MVFRKHLHPTFDNDPAGWREAPLTNVISRWWILTVCPVVQDFLSLTDPFLVGGPNSGKKEIKIILAKRKEVDMIYIYIYILGLLKMLIWNGMTIIFQVYLIVLVSQDNVNTLVKIKVNAL